MRSEFKSTIQFIISDIVIFKTGGCPGIANQLGIDRYDHTDNDTDTDYHIWIHIKPIPIPIILFGFISNRYRYRYICLAPYQTDTDNSFKTILTDYLQIIS